MLSQTFAEVVADRARRFTSFGRLLRNERGAIAIWFALSVVPLTIVTFGLVDLNRATIQKHNLQDSLDAAALYAARSTAVNDAQLKVQGDKALNANIQLKGGAKITSSTFRLEGVKVVASATAKVPAVMANLWLGDDMTVRVNTEVMRNSNNVEVALVLDTTGSMAGQPIIDLRNAANDLIDIVVKEQQSPFYSKVSVVPYSMAVNAGSYASAVRGSIPAAKSITNITWWKTGSSQKTITSITKAGTAVVTSNGHGYANDDYVYIWGVGNPMSGLGDKAYRVANKTTNTFNLKDANGNLVNTNSFSGAASSGKVRACETTNCDVIATAAGHGFSTNSRVRVTSVTGGADLKALVNDQTFVITSLSSSTFRLQTAQLKTTTTFTYSSAGSAWCTTLGCEFYYFTNPSGTGVTHRISTCVSERTQNTVYSDQYPVGLNYPAESNPCLSNTIYPLSSDKNALKSQINALVDEGSTAGHIGLAWGWYMVSPNFGSLWPNASSRPAAYSAPNTLKVVVWMTDGANNTAYCNGVIAGNSTSGSGSSNDHINCNATNGSSDTQSMALCNAMKSAGITIYSVGFNISGNTAANTLVRGCATSADHVYMANGGTALKDAFSAIGHEIENLRLSK